MFTRVQADVENISKLENNPKVAASVLKATFDKGPKDLKTVADALMTELEAKTAALSLGADVLFVGDTSDENVQAKMIFLYTLINTLIDEVKGGDIDDGVITEAMLNSTYAASLAKKNGELQTGLNAEMLGGKKVNQLDNAANISATTLFTGDVSTATVQAKLIYLYNAIQNLSIGVIADGSITEAKLNSTFSASLMRTSVLPRGAIIMWSGLISAIPSGWLLCNGANGTPDLRNRFIVGAGDSYDIGDTGGSDNIILTDAQMPSHNHSLSNNGEHSHTYTKVNTTQTAYGAGGSCYNGTITANTSATGAHTHVMGEAGSDEAHENRPPYYALAFIMKS